MCQRKKSFAENREVFCMQTNLFTNFGKFRALKMTKKLFLIRVLIMCAFLFLGPFCSAAQNENNSKKIINLEKEVHELKSQVKQLSRVRVEKRPSEFEIPKLNIRGFGHFQYEADEDDNDFKLGNLDLFISSQVSKKLKFFSELVFEFEKGGEQEIDVERLLLKYEYADWLNLSMGRGHTALGYWNHNYHHGRWLYTTIDRPAIFRFEDEGGILPVHFVGLELMGRIPVTIGNFTYAANVANGRGRTDTEVQLVDDNDDSKMGSFMFTFEPALVPGFGFGGNIVFDHIPNNPALGRLKDTQEIITGGHVFYFDSKIELIAEYQYVDHDSIVDNSHWGGYFQIAYKLGKIQPYYRFDILEIDSRDTFFASANDIDQHTFGIRYELFSFAAIKFEYRHASSRLSTQGTPNSGTIQVSFAF